MGSQGKILRRGEAWWGSDSSRITLVDVLRVDFSANVRAEGSHKLLLDLDHDGKVEVLRVCPSSCLVGRGVHLGLLGDSYSLRQTSQLVPVVENRLPVKETQETWVQSLSREDLWNRKWQPAQYSCLENSMDRGT